MPKGIVGSPVCIVVDDGTQCTNFAQARGLCSTHYARWRATGTTAKAERPSAADRFWSRVDKAGPTPQHVPELGPCWVWGGAGPSDYGWFYMDGRQFRPHRVSWFLHTGEWPKALLLHKCDNPPCVRPEHLREGDYLTNNRDTVLKGRHANTRKTHCKNGHEFTSENTGIRPTGGRWCRSCARLRTEEFRRQHMYPHRPVAQEYLDLFGDPRAR